MDVTIQLYAALAQVAETRKLTINLNPPVDRPLTVADLINHLKQHHPNWELDERKLSVAVNMEYATGSDAIHPDDEVALIPPVSGG